MPVKALFLTISLLLASCALKPEGEWVQYYQAETNKPYNDVLAELEIAIAEQNFRITGHSRVGKVIRKRENIEFPDYDTIQFCNLTHAKKMLLMSPHAVRHMPCNVVTYTYRGKVIVKTRLLPTDSDNPELNEFSAVMNDKLRQIVDFAAEE
ncbi:MAG: DUF302 domain-containing protein [Gammaproteobacteria bacterium]